jgi:hypothetical protein
MKSLILIALLLVQSSVAQTLTRGPYLQMATESSVTIRWKTSTSLVGRLNLGTTVGNLNIQVDGDAPRTDHVIAVAGLSPSTTYFYSVGTSGQVLAGGTPDFRFTTGPANGTSAPTRIMAFGDSGTGGPTQIAVRDALLAFKGTRSADVWLLLGDNAYNNGGEQEYQSNFFEKYPQFLRRTPVWSCLGNHDTANQTNPAGSYPYFQIFTFPTNGECGGVASGQEHYYSFNHGQTHFICLDSMTSDRSPTGAMANWLRADLAAAGNSRWIVAFWHHPPYSKGTHDSDFETPMVQMRTNFLPILEEGGVDLILCGHSHAYERSYLLDGHYGVSSTLTPAMKKNPGDGRPGGDGPYTKPRLRGEGHHGFVQVIAGSAGSADGGNFGHPAIIQSLNVPGALIIDVDDQRLDAVMVQPSGTPAGSSFIIADSFTILKQANPDSDGDGIPDDYESSKGLDPNNAADAALDQDADEITNLEEYVLETQPAPKQRVLPRVDPLTKDTRVAFYAEIGRNYRVSSSDDLIDWIVRSSWISGDNSSQKWIDDGSALPHDKRRFYRLEVAPAAP